MSTYCHGALQERRLLTPTLLIQKVRSGSGSHLPSDTQPVSSRARPEVSSVAQSPAARPSKSGMPALIVPPCSCLDSVPLGVGTRTGPLLPREQGSRLETAALPASGSYSNCCPESLRAPGGQPGDAQGHSGGHGGKAMNHPPLGDLHFQSSVCLGTAFRKVKM